MFKELKESYIRMRKFSPLFEQYTFDIQKIIVNLGLNVFNHIGMNKLSPEEIILKYSEKNGTMNEIYDSQIEEIKKRMKEENEIHRRELLQVKERYMKQEETLKEKHEIYLEKLHNKNQGEKDDINQQIKNQVSEKTNLQEELYQEKLKHLKKEISMLHQQMSTYQLLEMKLCDKTSFENPTEQGDYAEKILDDIVNEGLPYDDKATIKDTSDTGGSGDRIITFGNGFRLMIEAKNKDTIKKSDMDEFETHYMKDFKENKIDCALFYSYRQPQIPSKCKAIVLKYDSQTPNVCYYGLHSELTPIEKKEKVKQVIHEIYETYSMRKNETDVITSRENYNDIYNNYLEELNNEKLFMELKLKETDKYLTEYSSRLHEIKQKLNKLYQEIQKHNISVKKELLDDKLYVSMLREKIKGWFQERNIEMKQQTWKKIVRNEMGLSETDTKLINTIKISDFINKPNDI